MMLSVDQLWEDALQHHTADEIRHRLPKRISPTVLNRIPDDRWLSMMTKRIFQAGFVWRVIEQKWPDFEKLFFKFDPDRLAITDDNYFENLMLDKRIVRNWQKIATVMENAEFVLEIRKE